MKPLAARASHAWLALAPAARLAVVSVLLLVATLPVLIRLTIGRPADDLKVFMNGAEALLRGPLIYRDFVFEYPPYALLWFVVPRELSSDLDSFRLTFGLEMWLTDALIKALLLWYGVRARTGLRDLIPFVVYTLGSAALGHLLLMRYDLAPAFLTFGATLAVAGGWAFLGGVLVALGAGTKVYPALLIPMLAVFAWRRGREGLGRFIAGAMVATVPLVVGAFWAPWWRFASYHVERGLQAESLLASIVWALHFAGVPAGWALVWRAVEVTGPLAARLVGPGQVMWVVATLASTALATWTAWRMGGPAARTTPLAAMAALLLLPLAAFVSTNTVLSPQFHLWLLPLAALVLLPLTAAPGETDASTITLPVEARRAAWCIVVATLIVPVFYPHREYATGLGMVRTSVLVLRNLLLLYATACLWIGARKMPGPVAWSSNRRRVRGPAHPVDGCSGTPRAPAS